MSRILAVILLVTAAAGAVAAVAATPPAFVAHEAERGLQLLGRS